MSWDVGKASLRRLLGGGCPSYHNQHTWPACATTGWGPSCSDADYNHTASAWPSSHLGSAACACRVLTLCACCCAEEDEPTPAQLAVAQAAGTAAQAAAAAVQGEDVLSWKWFDLGLAAFPSTCLILCTPLARKDLQCTAGLPRHAACVMGGLQKGMGPVKWTLSLRHAASLTALKIVEPTVTARHAMVGAAAH